MKKKTDKKTVKDELENQLKRWQTKMDEAKLQMHLGMKDTEDKIKPHVEKLDKELNEAKIKLEAFEQSSEGAWKEVKAGVESSIYVMKMAFDSAKEHFTKDK